MVSSSGADTFDRLNLFVHVLVARGVRQHHPSANNSNDWPNPDSVLATQYVNFKHTAVLMLKVIHCMYMYVNVNPLSMNGIEKMPRELV